MHSLSLHFSKVNVDTFEQCRLKLHKFDRIENTGHTSKRDWSLKSQIQELRQSIRLTWSKDSKRSCKQKIVKTNQLKSA